MYIGMSSKTAKCMAKLVLSYLSMTTDILVYGYMVCCVNNCQVSDLNLLSLCQDKEKYFINTTVE